MRNRLARIAPARGMGPPILQRAHREPVRIGDDWREGPGHRLFMNADPLPIHVTDMAGDKRTNDGGVSKDL